MKLTFNPYALVIDANGTLNIILSDPNNPVQICATNNQKFILERLYQGNFTEYEELCSIFSKQFIDSMVQAGCLVPFEIDTQSMYSRTDAFFLTHGMSEVRARLDQKNVLILGCGGIGTHMAWHMTALGIRKITIVDFDTVETSNLNRQILFDNTDVGKNKVDVLKQRLSAINQDIQIETICTRVSSEEELESICTAEKFDLIIKAVDSPAEFPQWLDNVTKKHNLTYVAGITMRENVLIGPSFIPGKSSYGWSELMDLGDSKNKKVHGTAPSLGIMLYHISDELAIEAFKILTGYGEVKYVDKILCKNLLTDDEHVFDKKKSEIIRDHTSLDNGSGINLLLEFLMIVSLSVAGIMTHWFLPIAFVAAMFLPFVLYKTNQNVVRCTFLNATVFSIGMLLTLAHSFDLSTATALIASLVISFGVYSAITLVMCVANYFIHKIVRREK